MNGKKYLDAFEGVGLGAPEDPEAQGLADSHSAQLTNKIVLLYSVGEVAFIGDDIAPQAVVEADESIRDKRYVYEAGALALKNLRRGHATNGQRWIPDKVVLTRPSATESTPEATEESPMQRAARAIEDDCDRLQFGLTQHSDVVLSHALVNLQRMIRGSGGELKPGQAAESARLAITSQRRPMFEVVEPWRGIVSFSRDIYNSKTVGFSTEVSRSHKHVPEWMQQIDDWHQPLHRLSAAITELEALITAQEWVISRGLPFVPVIAPKHLEGGLLNGSKNPHADLLLCNISPDSNEIIPIQIKNTMRAETRQRYIKGMNFLTPQSLGLVSSKNHPIRMDDGRVRTGIRVTVELGAIIEGFYECYGQRRRKPSKDVCRNFDERTRPGFEYFDMLLTTSRA